jgi:hypothetical protein
LFVIKLRLNVEDIKIASIVFEDCILFHGNRFSSIYTFSYNQFAMNRILLFVILFFCSVCICKAQAPAIQWEKTFGSIYDEQATCTQQTTDGGYIVAGYANRTSDDVTGNHGGYDFWVVKLSVTGTLQWQQCYGGSSDDMAYCIQQTADGGYIVSGSTVSTDGQVTGLHPSPGNPLWGDYWIIKIDNNGALQWQRTLGGTGFDEAHSIVQTTDGGYIVSGVTNSGDGDFVNGGNIVKLSSTGAIQWNSYQGGSFNYSVKQTTDGGYIVAGTILNQFSVLKLDSSGAHQWWKFYGGSGYDQANSAMQTTDGGYILAGYTQSADGDVTGFNGGISDGWIIKLDSAGNLQWQKTVGGSFEDEANSIKQTAEGGYIVAGVTNSNDKDVSGLHGVAGGTYANGATTDYWVVKISNTGTIEWQKPMGSSYVDVATSIEPTTDGGYIVAGSTANNIVNDGDVTGFHLNISLPNASGFDYWIVKLAPDPIVLTLSVENFTASKEANAVNVVWQMAAETSIKKYEIERSRDGNNFTTIGELAAIDTSGNYTYPDNNPLKGNSFYRLVIVSNDGTKNYSNIIEVTEIASSENVNFYPNPVVNHSVTVDLSNISKGVYQLMIFNNLGQDVYNTIINYVSGDLTQLINLPQTITTGIYTIQLKKGSSIFNGSLLVK